MTGGRGPIFLLTAHGDLQPLMIVAIFHDSPWLRQRCERLEPLGQSSSARSLLLRFFAHRSFLSIGLVNLPRGFVIERGGRLGVGWGLPTCVLHGGLLQDVVKVERCAKLPCVSFVLAGLQSVLIACASHKADCGENKKDFFQGILHLIGLEPIIFGEA